MDEFTRAYLVEKLQIMYGEAVSMADFYNKSDEEIAPDELNNIIMTICSKQAVMIEVLINVLEIKH